jgi:hypothetical protein
MILFAPWDMGTIEAARVFSTNGVHPTQSNNDLNRPFLPFLRPKLVEQDYRRFRV